MTEPRRVQMPSNFELARRSCGLTQGALGDLANVSRLIINLCERHQYVPGEDVKLRLACALNVEPLELWAE